MDLIGVEIYGDSSFSASARSRSVDPLAKQKRLVTSTIMDEDKAADQLIENTMNRFVTEVKEDEIRKEQDYLE